MVGKDRVCDYCGAALSPDTHWRRRFCSDTHRYGWWTDMRMARVNLERRVAWARQHYWSEKVWHGKRHADRWLADEMRVLVAQATELGVDLEEGAVDA